MGLCTNYTFQNDNYIIVPINKMITTITKATLWYLPKFYLNIQRFLRSFSGIGTRAKCRSRDKTCTDWKRTSQYRPKKAHDEYFSMPAMDCLVPGTLSWCRCRWKITRNAVWHLIFKSNIYLKKVKKIHKILGQRFRLFIFNSFKKIKADYSEYSEHFRIFY